MMSTQNIILPGQCIGILGGGQLGRMLAMVAKQMGYKVAILEPVADCPAAPFADYHIKADYADNNALQQLAKLSQVITTEFENVPAASILALKVYGARVFPDDKAIQIAQNREREKTFFRSIGLKTADFALIHSVAECELVPINLLPGILKTTTLGYDGKGQIRVTSLDELRAAYLQLGGECILEQLVTLKAECSIIVARNRTGVKCYPVIENQHRKGILDISYIPAQINGLLANEAQLAATKLIEALEYIGILTIEFFITEDGQLLVNEIAPRPHNSGHITIESCVTSQFEQQLRAVCGLQLGDVALKQEGAMLNLLGDVWLDNPEAFNSLVNDYVGKFHWYDKIEAKPGRKMGHISITMSDRKQLENKIASLKATLKISN